MIRFIPRRYWAVIAVALALTMSVLDGTIVNVALPTLSREFGTSPSSTIPCNILATVNMAGAILSVASWNWLFAINVPLGICAIITGYFLLPQNPCKDGPKRKFDKIGGISNALTFGLLIYSLEGIAHHENWRMIALQVLLLLVIGTFFIRRQLRQEVPILPLDLMRIPIFANNSLTRAFVFLSFAMYNETPLHISTSPGTIPVFMLSASNLTAYGTYALISLKSRFVFRFFIIIGPVIIFSIIYKM